MTTPSKAKQVQLSNIASIICGILFDSPQPRDFRCPYTGETIKYSADYKRASVVNPRATGAHYRAHGFLYLLCHDPEHHVEYIAVHVVKDHFYVGDVGKKRRRMQMREVACSKYGIK